MFDEVSVLVISLCFVNASVVVNIYDDDVKTSQKTSLPDVQDRDLRWCEQQCKRAGFSGGACVGDRCKCDILNSKVGMTSNLQVCSLRGCGQQCRLRGFPGGVCVGDRCKCDVIAHHNALRTLEVPVGTSCSELACQLLCLSLGFSDGTCIRTQCECIMLKATGIANNEIPTDEVSADDEETKDGEDAKGSKPQRLTSQINKKKCHPLQCCIACIRGGGRCGFCTPYHTCMCF